MRLYPKVIPTIARETIQRLMQDGDIEVETLRIADAEMDMSAIMREYLANEAGRADVGAGVGRGFFSSIGPRQA